MSEQFVSFRQSGATLDTGEKVAAAIRPVADGENAIAAVFSRPSENLRTRTETLRSAVDDLLYLIDADRGLLVSGGGNMTWAGHVAGGGTGIFTTTADLTIRPFLAPAASTKAKATIRGVRFETILAPVGAINPPRAYSGANKISVEIVGSNGATLACTVDGTPADNVTITIDTTPVTGTTKSQLITFLTTDLGAGAVAFRNLGLTAVLASGAGSDVLIASGAINPSTDFQRLSGAADAERHVITAAGLAAFFAASAGANVLQEGDVLCIQYDTLVNGAGGGRRESILDAPESSSNADSNLFNLRLFPERLPLALPVAVVINDQLRFIDGTVLTKNVASTIGGGFVPLNGGTMTGVLVMGGVNIEPLADNTGAKIGTSAKRFVEANAVLGSFNNLESTAGGVLGSASNAAKRYTAHLTSLTVYDAAGIKAGSNNLPLGDATNRFAIHAEEINVYGTNGIRPNSTNTKDIGTTSLRFKDAWFSGTVVAGVVNVDLLNASGALTGTLGPSGVGAGLDVFRFNINAQALTIWGAGISAGGATKDLGAATSAATRFNVFGQTVKGQDVVGYKSAAPANATELITLNQRSAAAAQCGFATTATGAPTAVTPFADSQINIAAVNKTATGVYEIDLTTPISLQSLPTVSVSAARLSASTFVHVDVRMSTTSRIIVRVYTVDLVANTITADDPTTNILMVTKGPPATLVTYP